MTTKYYEEHREQIIERVKKWRKDNPELSQSKSKDYYQRNKDKRKEYYIAHREERLAYAKRLIKHHGVTILRNVDKPIKPNSCSLCKRQVTFLAFHHWEDDHPEVGLWVCNKCHWAIHRMIKVGLLKANVSSQSTVTSGITLPLLAVSRK